MICYKDRTYCASKVEHNTWGRELSKEDLVNAQELDLPIAYSTFCEECSLSTNAHPTEQ